MNIVKAGTVYKENKYHVPLPFKNDNIMLPSNINQAMKRLQYLQRKFSKDENFKDLYVKSMNDMFKKGYAEVSPEKKYGKDWFIPHQGVINPNKVGKLRVVFDCSAEVGGRCINKELLKGPDLTNHIVGTLLRFREDFIAVQGDIEGMFLQVRIPPEQRSYFKFLWFKDDDVKKDIIECQMTSHVIGGTSSPSCANYALRRTAEDNKDDFKTEVVQSLSRNFYVDDLLKSLPSINTAIEFIKEVKVLCKRGGFNLTKFLSNSKEVMSSINLEDRKSGASNEDLQLQDLPEDSALGMLWDTQQDKLKFKINMKNKPLTRRGILSVISSVYDPLGLAGPFILKGRQILQKICKDNLSWDEPIPEHIKEEWLSWKDQLEDIEKLSLERCCKPRDFGEVKNVQLHLFADASDEGYGVAVYLRMTNKKDQIHCVLIYGRSRVAPLKYVSIPRMELTAAVLSAKTSNMLKQELDIKIDQTFFWTDSQVVLGYIKNEARTFKIFVANRVQQIQDTSDVKQWFYVTTKENPADVASRGLNQKQEKRIHQWFKGPDFLWKQQSTWKQSNESKVATEDPEVKLQAKVNVVISKTSLLQTLCTRSNSWKKLVNIMVHIKRFIRLLKEKVSKATRINSQSEVEAFQHAKTTLFMLVQEECFSEDIIKIKNKQPLKKSSSIIKLNPFLDNNNILRVGGRLQRSTLSIEEKHPIILPSKHQVSKMVIDWCHSMVAHSGRGITLNKVRECGFWIIGGSSLTKNIISKCVTCRKLYGSTGIQKMSQLPRERSEVVPPFTYCGVDMFGPFYVKERRSVLKRYGAIFTCLNSRAVHLEITNSMTTDAFILALRRFIGRRGNIRTMRSDNGTNFVGCNNELKRCLQEMDQLKISRFLLSNNADWVKWKFNPPYASHMGGVWERQIRSARRILTSLLETHGESLNDESLRTLMIETEAIINSRPLTVENLNDPDSDKPLSPAKLLTSKSNVVLPPPGNFERPDLYSRKYWRRVQHVADEFWSRWRKEFLISLQTMQKWHQVIRNFQIGDVVLLKETTDRNDWRMGRIVNVQDDFEGNVRCVYVKVYNDDSRKHEVLRRPITKLVLLVENAWSDSPPEEPLCQNVDEF